jgi:nicotinate-nucleotide adenylyltransferase
MTVHAENQRNKKIGLLGGTFDPVHNGHLAVAHHVFRELSLDAIWFIPASSPPHKSAHGDTLPITAFHHRAAMLEKAISQYPSYLISEIETERSAPSYSIDTINILLQDRGLQADLYFIIGADAFLEIDTWKRYKELPALVNFVVISRPGYPPDNVGTVIRKNFTNYTYDSLHETWSSPHSKGVFILQHMDPVPISSTEIRKKVRRGEDIAGLVPQEVEDYIKRENLYIYQSKYN